MDGGWIRNWVRLPEGDFNVDLVGVRFDWPFTPKSYHQAFTQYHSQNRQVGTNIRLALLSTSSTGLFVVLNTRVLTEPFTDPHRVRRRTESRVLYFKYSYLFDFQAEKRKPATEAASAVRAAHATRVEMAKLVAAAARKTALGTAASPTRFCEAR